MTGTQAAASARQHDDDGGGRQRAPTPRATTILHERLGLTTQRAPVSRRAGETLSRTSDEPIQTRRILPNTQVLTLGPKYERRVRTL